MEGQAVVDLTGPDYNGGRGTLATLLRDPATAGRFRHLQAADGNWTVRDDVWVRYQREDQPLLAGPLTVGFTVYGDRHHFGPELQLGHVLGDCFLEPVLLVKTAWGGKSLARDFRPPSADGETGKYYALMIQQIRDALANFETEFPALRGRNPELAGFVWYHGWNDGVDPQHAVPEYEANLVHLIRDIRRDLHAPRLPVVIGELTGPWVHAEGEWEALRNAQAAAAAHSEFTGQVLFVPTHDFVRAPENSPNPTHGHHEFGNAETYFLVSDALGRGVLRLLFPADAMASQILDDTVAAPERERLVGNSLPQAAAVIRAMTADMSADPAEEYRRIPWIWRIAIGAGKQNDAAVLQELMAVALPELGEPLRDWQAVVLGGGIVNGLSQAGVEPAARVHALLQSPQQDPVRLRWAKAIELAAAMVDDESTPMGTRYDALRILGAADWPTYGELISKYLAAETHPELQMGAVSAAGDVSHDSAGRALIAHLPALTSENRARAIEAMLLSPAKRHQLSAALTAGQINVEWLNAEQRQQLQAKSQK